MTQATGQQEQATFPAQRRVDITNPLGVCQTSNLAIEYSRSP